MSFPNLPILFGQKKSAHMSKTRRSRGAEGVVVWCTNVGQAMRVVPLIKSYFVLEYFIEAQFVAGNEPC